MPNWSISLKKPVKWVKMAGVDVHCEVHSSSKILKASVAVL